MSKFYFEINYNIYPEHRDSYINAVEELKSIVGDNPYGDFFVFENSKIANNFSEIYICNSEEEFEQLEDTQNELARDVINNIVENYVVDKKLNYFSKKEI
jgi:hypothetical protein